MAVTSKPLFQALQAQNSETTQYVTPSGTRTILDKFTGTNTTVSPVTLTVKIVAAGGTPWASNTIIFAKTVAAGTDWGFPSLVGHTLNPGDFISTLADTSSAITIRASGREVT